MTWKQNSTGWWLERSDGSYPTNCWIQKDQVWYYFDNSGYMATGWRYVGGYWYYLSASGAMVSNNWVLANNKWYFLGTSGAMRTGWVEWNGSWYYLNIPNGDMAVNCATPDGYRVNISGVWIQ